MKSILIKLFFALVIGSMSSYTNLAQADSSKESKKNEIYSQTNSKGVTYYLYKKEVTLKNSEKTRTIYFFAKSANNKKGTPLKEVPANKIVAETKNGLLVLKNKTVSK